jgi:hypothetical protein
LSQTSIFWFWLLLLLFSMSLFDWPISKKFLRFPSTKVFTPNLETYKSQYRPTYVGFKRTMLGEHIGQSDTLLLGTCWGTHWELDENTWEHKRPNTSPPSPHEKEFWLYWVHVASPHLLSRIYNPNCVHGLFCMV